MPLIAFKAIAPVREMIPDVQGAEQFEPLGDFDFDKTSASPGASTDHFIDRRLSNMELSDNYSPKYQCFGPIHAPLPFRPQKTFVKCEKPTPVISGTQLLDLEGRPAKQERMTALGSMAQWGASNMPALRRKPNFCGNVYDVNGGLAQSSSAPPNEDYSAYRPPASPVYTQQRMESIGLHAGVDSYSSFASHYPGLRRPPEKNLGNGIDSGMSPHRKAWSEASINLPQQHQHHASMVSYGLEGPSSLHDEDRRATLTPLTSGSDYERRPQLQPLYTYLPKDSRRDQSRESDYALSDDLGVPSSSETFQWSSTVSDLMEPSYSDSIPYTPPIHQSHPTTLSPEDSNNYYSDFTQIDINHSQIPRPPQTPPPSNPSASPGSPPPVAKALREQQAQLSPQKQARNRRKQGALRMPKSTAALKSAKSNGNLKAAKSTGNLKSRKSAGNLGGGAGERSPIKKGNSTSRPQIQSQQLQAQAQQQQANWDFGFMNFTPNDKDKILTGVAPSGSSKTKARRELQEKEQKRRMSLAAKKEIQRLGGEVPAEFADLDE